MPWPRYVPRGDERKARNILWGSFGLIALGGFLVLRDYNLVGGLLAVCGVVGVVVAIRVSRNTPVDPPASPHSM